MMVYEEVSSLISFSLFFAAGAPALPAGPFEVGQFNCLMIVSAKH
jgi:hypothetical protein